MPGGGGYVAEVDAWHAKREARLRSDTGWLTLVGLHELQQGAQTIGAAGDIVIEGAEAARIGTITVIGSSVNFAAERGVVVQRQGGDGERVTNVAMVVDTQGEATVLESGPILWQVIERNGRLYLRVKDRNAETLKQFKGIARYPVDARYRVEAKLVPGTAREIGVPNVLGGVDMNASPGAVEFVLDGKTLRLTPTVEEDGSLFFVFGDATNGRGTYPAGRFLSAEAIGEDGRVVLDFNRATNPMCAFTAYATCPLPPEGNTLPITVEAGERYPLAE